MKNLMLFLRESNKIENVYDELSLTYARAAWDYLKKQKKLTRYNILKTHAILSYGKLDPEETGAYRKRSVWIGEHEAKSWYAIPELMEEWIKDAHTSIEVPGEDGNNIKLDHITFEAIHPFVNFNGRMGRLLMNWQRIKCGLPILVIKEKTKRTDYYPWFNKLPVDKCQDNL